MQVLSNTISQINNVCNSIDHLWAIEGRSIETFSDITLSCTKNLDLLPISQTDELVDFIRSSELKDIQELSSFSDLYLKLYDNGKMWVEVLHWYGSDINIHDHDFAAVQFQIKGNSLNVNYTFQPDRVLSNMAFGKLKYKSAELWKPGDKSLVSPGRDNPHNVFHLSNPTISLLFRTYPEKNQGPQWNYFSPGVAADYGIANPSFRKKIKLLRLLAQKHSERFRSAYLQCSTSLKPEEFFFISVKLIDFIFDAQYVDLIPIAFKNLNNHGERMLDAIVLFRATEILKQSKNTQHLEPEKIAFLSAISAAPDSASLDNLFDILGLSIPTDANFSNEVRSWKQFQRQAETASATELISSHTI